MGLKSDLEEAKKMWVNSSLLMKLFIITSLFITTSSMASLSDAIFKWKGLILDGIDFYHNYVADPAIQLLALIGLQYSPLDVNVFILVSLYAGSYFRTVGLSELWGYFKAQPLSQGFVYLCFLSSYITAGVREEHLSTYLVLAVYSTALIFSLVYLCMHRKSSNELFLRFISVPLLSLFIVLILGAINSGLSRS